MTHHPTQGTLITRRVEFDAGHRIPNHASKCKNVHGHRYVLEATALGPLHRSGSQEGMVVDFGILKEVMLQEVVNPWDHAFLCWQNDTEMRRALDCLPGGHKTVMLDAVPTAENLVAYAHRAIQWGLDNHSPVLLLVRTRLYETPNCWADYFETEVK